ncbi:RNA-directed DNA polymerase from mobile element jockey [Plakobranchus ocellatus]|uniref:RNA-directed DNA polymerase from mobile element jockey n=1 Tax=Plakobranchus ocellatus TaxID=259542 RepID=A0AAV3ZNZ3_9GAST|nr:RNA-directed DNA polymerase from mobile element jockey [Plakobranchus ocellatus]
MVNFINIHFGNVKFQRNFLQFHFSVDFDELNNWSCVPVILCCVGVSKPWFILQTCSAVFEPRTPLIDLGHRHCMFTGGSPRGEAALLIRNGIRFSEIDLKTGLHAAAVTISLAKTLTVCSLYLPPNSPVSKLSLTELFEQLPKPFLVLGDFNAHSPVWGGTPTWMTGEDVEEFTAENDFIILNSGEQTFVHSAYHSTSAIDLAVASPSIAAECSWAAHSDLCGSNHYPIFFNIVLTF